MGLIERISTGINRLADRTNQALDEGRMRLDLMRARRRRDHLARDLGFVTFRQVKGAPPADGEVDGLVRRMDDCDADIAKLEQQLQQVRSAAAPEPGSGDTPGQGGAETGPAPDAPNG
jgi:hypothetical protein